MIEWLVGDPYLVSTLCVNEGHHLATRKIYMNARGIPPARTCCVIMVPTLDGGTYPG